MRPITTLLAVLLVGGSACRHPEATAAPRSEPPTDEARPVPPAAAHPGGGGTSLGSLSGTMSKPSGLAVPPTVGETRMAVEGCLLTASEEGGARFPPPPVSRAGGSPHVILHLVEGGVVLEHALAHACCLKVRTSAKLGAGQAVVTEELSGTACRCRCGSTIRTALRLPAGEWSVALDLEEHGSAKRQFQQAVHVQ